MDSSAINYDETATQDDDSCIYTLPEATSLFFSEYAEGSSNNKYLEIYNPSSETVDLTWYALASVTNAPSVVGEYENWFNFPEGASIAPGDVYIVAHGSSNEAILAEADQTLSSLSNGDDGFALVYGEEGYSTVETTVEGSSDCCINPAWIDPMGMCPFIYDPVVGCDGVEYSNSCMAQIAGVSSWTDSFGVVTDLDWDCSETTTETTTVANFEVLDWLGDFNGDPGSAWDVAGVSNATKDHTLVRKCGIMEGNEWSESVGTDASDSEWVVEDQDVWIFLGSHTTECPEPVYGCTDSTACNYDENATDDNGTCGVVDDCGDCQVPYCYVLGGTVSYVSIFDCAGGVAGNDNVNLFAGDGIWVGIDSSDEYWLGSSWNPYWNGGCTITPGCMDTAACNFDYAATEDDGSCEYPEFDYVDCDGGPINGACSVNGTVIANNSDYTDCKKCVGIKIFSYWGLRKLCDIETKLDKIESLVDNNKYILKITRT